MAECLVVEAVDGLLRIVTQRLELVGLSDNSDQGEGTYSVGQSGTSSSR